MNDGKDEERVDELAPGLSNSGTGGTSSAEIPSEESVLRYFTTLSNWGRWGRDDDLGTVNLVTPAVRRRAAAAVSEGLTVSCSWDIEPVSQVGDHYGPSQRFMVRSGEGMSDQNRVRKQTAVIGLNSERAHTAAEYIGLVAHSANLTHIDAVSHMFWDGRMYNDRPASLVSTQFGATKGAVSQMSNGIVTRGILVDIARHRNVEWLGEGSAVHPGEIETVLTAAGIAVEPGDALLVRTGYGAYKRRVGARPAANGLPGFHASCLPWLKDKDVALIGSDVGNDVIPSGYQSVPMPIHLVGIVSMGLCLIDSCDLESLSGACKELRRIDFMLIVAPLRLVGGTGSPVNVLATF